MLYRSLDDQVEVLIAHPGGPFWTNEDAGAWSIPKGLIHAGEDAKMAAVRELTEETGCVIDAEDAWLLGEVTLRSGKRVIAFAAAGECAPEKLVSNTFEMEWPPRSGRTASFPEIDRIEWMEPEDAMEKLNPAQAPLVRALLHRLDTMC